MIDLFLPIGLGAITLYYLSQIYRHHCINETETPINIIIEEEEETPPKYEDIVADNSTEI